MSGFDASDMMLALKLRKARAEALEEAARECEKWAQQLKLASPSEIAAGHDCAARIRGLVSR